MKCLKCAKVPKVVRLRLAGLDSRAPQNRQSRGPDVSWDFAVMAFGHRGVKFVVLKGAERKEGCQLKENHPGL